MDKPKDRRSFDRQMFPEKTAFLINTNWYYLLRYKLFRNIAISVLGKTLVQNISASGSCIQSPANFKQGEAIHLFINRPGEKSIFIKGTVRWSSSIAQSKMHFIGIQFLAYGNRRRYNSYGILDQLRNYAHQKAVLIGGIESSKIIISPNSKDIRIS